MTLTLYIGNKNYSSWSLRAWLLMRQLDIPFTEVRLRLDMDVDSPFRRAVAAVSPAARVPVLVDDTGFAVWDTLAIAETLAEWFPQAGVWPDAARARARARSVCAEMHAGFGALRSACPMNIEAALSDVGAQVYQANAGLQRDVLRLEALWTDALAASGGPFLFGRFSAADAFFAPVASRFKTYGLPAGDASQRWMAALHALPSWQAWVAEALQEHDFIAEDEPYRSAPGTPAPPTAA